jgi:hypothetical protein
MTKLALSLALATLFLVGCSQAPAPNTAPPVADAAVATDINLAKLVGLTGIQLYQTNGTPEAVCMVNEFELPGQGFWLSGSTGGLSYFPILNPIRPARLGFNLQTSLFNNTLPNKNSIILIPDDFKNGVYTLGAAVFNQSSLTPAVLQQLQSTGQLSHGALVARHANEVIRGTLRYVLLSYSAGEWVYREIATGARLVVKAIDTGFTTTESIAIKIQQALPLLDRYKIERAVINMSFALLPCTVIEDYKVWEPTVAGIQGFSDYMKELATKNEVSYDSLVPAIIESTNSANDGLYQLIQGSANGADKHVYVGASGNFGLAYPMYPANWPGVVNVSGAAVDNPATSTVNENRLLEASLFNSGEILHTAVSMRLDPPGWPFFGLGKPLYYMGTSFSTPTVSVFSALDLATQAQRCSNGGMSALAKNSLELKDRHLENWISDGGIEEEGAARLLCGY